MEKFSQPQDLAEEFISKRGIGDRLLERMLEALHDGYPVSKLELLLRHSDTSVAKSAGWVLSELGQKGRDLIPVSYELLSHPLEQLRADAISHLLANSDRCPSHVAWSIIGRYTGETKTIQEDIVNFVARVPIHLLSDAISFAIDASAQSHTLGLSLHAGLPQVEPIQEALMSNDPLVRGYALSAVRRLEIHIEALWRVAARSNDPVLHAIGTHRIRLKR